MPALVAALRDANASVREAAAKALGGIGPDAEPAIPGLVNLIRDYDPFVRGTAAGVLVRMGPAAVPGLAELLRDGNPQVRRVASQALRHLDLRTETDSAGRTDVER